MATSKTGAPGSPVRPRAKAAPRRVNPATLAGLGVDRLADLLTAAAKTGAVLKRALTAEPERLADELDRQITRVRKASLSTRQMRRRRCAKL